ncbi:von Willebrand factor type A domain-containing protein [Xylaria cf. heliscus]|nr:von Willebrand factor type A domain-containing protein [Xylaria cf. heliscus]
MARTKQTIGRGNASRPLIGCWYALCDPATPWLIRRSYLPLSSLRAHTIIKDVASRTTLTQSFPNETNEHLKDMVYSFPLYGGVSVVSFTATIGDVHIKGIVKDKQQARLEFKDAVTKGKSAALLEQLPEASDVFTTHIGNVPAGSSVVIELVYIGELNYDAEADGSRFTIPTFIAPRYGATPDNILSSSLPSSSVQNAIQFVVDVQSPEGNPVHGIQSPSHPIAVNIGRTTDMPTEAFVPHRGSATLSLNSYTLDKDFVVMVNVANANVPKALLETHSTIPNQHALLVTLVPRFQLPSSPSEVVFVVDRSGSMGGKMGMVIQAMNTMLKSLRVGIKFNICSFGSQFSFIWPRSKSYNEMNLEKALKYVDELDSNLGGTEMIKPVQAVLSQRHQDLALNVIMLTDGEIWAQDALFKIISESQHHSRFFSLGIGHGASTSLVQGIATEGNGICQFVAEGEPMDKKMVRLLKGALTQHLNNYSLDMKFKRDDEDYEMIESNDASKVTITLPVREKKSTEKTPMTFFKKELSDEVDEDRTEGAKGDRFAHVPRVSAPSILQAPFQVPPLYPFSRTTMYLLLDPSTYGLTPESVIFRASTEDGPIELEIKVEDIGKGETIHQLAAKKAVSELEAGRGWLSNATDKDSNVSLKTQYKSLWNEIVEREAIHLGTKYQIASKWCSFIAVEGDEEHEPISFKGQMPRVSSGGAPPRRQLASKAARRSAPSGAPPKKKLASNAARKSVPSGPVIRQEPVAAKPADAPPEKKMRTTPPRRSARLQSNASGVEKMHALIRLQKFDGSWEWDQSLVDITGADLAKAKKPIRKDSIVATALAIAFLRIRVAHEAGSWELVVDKAVCWLAGQNGIDSDIEIQDAGALLA